MASYFDIKPNAAAGHLDTPHKDAFGNTGLISPQVTRILDDPQLNEKSSSDDENASLSGDSEEDNQVAAEHRKPRFGKAKTHTAAHHAQTKYLPVPTEGGDAGTPSHHLPKLGSVQKHPHLARFHSLRSMLFSSQIEANIEQCNEAKEKEEAEKKWKSEHHARRGLSRPKTPEAPPKDGLTHRIGNKIRRMTSKEVPTMKQVNEDRDNESTASSEDDDDDERRRTADDHEEINHSDIEELVRWVSRTDPPSDGEKRYLKAETKEDSGHESLGNSDVEELVRWVSRKDKSSETKSSDAEIKERSVYHQGQSAVSTEYDAERTAERKGSIDDEDVDNLLRWVSRRESSHDAQAREIVDGASQKVSDAHDNNFLGQSEDESMKGVARDDDVDELVQWVLKKNPEKSHGEMSEDKIADKEREKGEKMGATEQEGSVH